MALLNPYFNSSKQMSSSFVDKVTTGIYNIVSATLNFAFVGLLISGNYGFSSVPVPINSSLVTLLVNTHFSDHVKIRFISQLISDIFSVLQKVIYFSGTTISASFCFVIKRF